MRQLIFALAIVVGSPGLASSQQFNARDGYIFDQKFVTRIKTPEAAKLLAITDIDQKFLALYDKRGKARDEPMPMGVKRVVDAIVFERPGKATLLLTDFVYKGKDDAGDSQKFSYLKELEKFHVLSVSFDHDRPCFMLVDKTSMNVFFIDY